MRYFAFYLISFFLLEIQECLTIFFLSQKGFCHTDPRVARRAVQQHGYSSGRQRSPEEGSLQQHTAHHSGRTVREQDFVFITWKIIKNKTFCWYSGRNKK